MAGAFSVSHHYFPYQICSGFDLLFRYFFKINPVCRKTKVEKRSPIKSKRKKKAEHLIFFFSFCLFFEIATMYRFFDFVHFYCFSTCWGDFEKENKKRWKIYFFLKLKQHVSLQQVLEGGSLFPSFRRKLSAAQKGDDVTPFFNVFHPSFAILYRNFKVL